MISMTLASGGLGKVLCLAMRLPLLLASTSHLRALGRLAASYNFIVALKTPPATTSNLPTSVRVIVISMTLASGGLGKVLLR